MSARLASEIFLSSLQSEFSINLLAAEFSEEQPKGERPSSESLGSAAKQFGLEQDCKRG
jgi:hypothetical protein